MYPHIARRDDGPAIGDFAALPIGDDSAGAFNDRNECGNIPSLQFGLDHQIDKTHRDERVGVAIAAIARQARRFLDAKILRAFLILEMLRQPESRLRVMRFMQAADIDIDRLELREEEGTGSLPPAMQGIAGVFVQGQPLSQQRIWRVLAWHKRADEGEEVAFELFDESDGTQKLFEFVGGWLRALDSGATLFVDELDRSLHPKLTRYLVELFNSSENRKNAQLVFTTHDTTLLDPDLLRRDQIWFVEKNKERASHVYSLLEFSPRKDEALERGYLKGRYGAIPLIGRWEW